MKKVLTPNNLKEAKKLHKEGLPYSQIASKLGISKSSVFIAIRKDFFTGIKARGNKLI